MQSLVYFLITLSLLVAVHEYGHFWMARRCGVKVLKFSIGFGKVIYQKTDAQGTQFVLSLIPLGGYVKMLDEREAPAEAKLLSQAFNRQSLLSRIAIVGAGPLANLIFAVMIYWLIGIIGVEGIKTIISDVKPDSIAERAQIQPGAHITHINGEPTPTWQSALTILDNLSVSGGEAQLIIDMGLEQQEKTLIIPKRDSTLSDSNSTRLLDNLGLETRLYSINPVVGRVLVGSPASIAGFEVGDKILAINDVTIRSWTDWVDKVRASPMDALNVTIERLGLAQQLEVIPNKTADGLGVVGMAVDIEATRIPSQMKATLSYDPITALLKAFEKTTEISWVMISTISGILQGEISGQNLGGPITIAQFAGSSADRGLITFLNFLAMISISLGILNLLPIPVLDGGHLMFYFIEAVKGSPVSEQHQRQAQQLGLMIVMILMVYAFSNDLSRAFGL